MVKEILYKYAEDINGKIIHINNVLTGENYFCPDCKEKFVFKKGKIRQKHFAHNNINSNCTGEGYLHKTFKKILLEFIKYNVVNKIPMNILIECNKCHNKILMNILGNCLSVKDEYDMKICRPDIALIEENGNVYAVFEIVVTHKPEDNIIDYYQKNNIILFQIKLETENDLENINETINNKIEIKTRPDYFNACINPNCISRRRIPYRGAVKRSRRF